MQSNPKIGITTTVPVEIILAAGYIPVDINNIFINDQNPSGLVDKAERAGFPQNTCSWIKGLYQTIMTNDIKKVLSPVWGDCSNSFALSEILLEKGLEVIEFQYPFDRDINRLKESFHKLYDDFGVSESTVLSVHNDLQEIRRELKKLDDLTINGKVSGKENHIFLVSSSDFEGDPEKFLKKLKNISYNSNNIDLSNNRVGIIGVPPIFTDFYDSLDEMGFSVVYNEIPAEFSMIKSIDRGFYEKYIEYSYPYGMRFRLKTIKKEIERRDLKGLIHYTQCFCYRQIEDIILRNNVDIPILTIEGDRPAKLDSRSRMRLENFLELL